MELGPHGTCPTRRRLTLNEIVQAPKWSRSSPSVIDTVRVRQRRKSLTDWRQVGQTFSLRPGSDDRFAISTAIPCPQHLELTRCMSTHGYIRYLLAYFWMFFCVRYTLRVRILSLREKCFSTVYYFIAVIISTYVGTLIDCVMK